MALLNYKGFNSVLTHIPVAVTHNSYKQIRKGLHPFIQGEHSAILSTFIKLPFVIKIFVLSIFEWPLKTGFTVTAYLQKYYLWTYRNILAAVTRHGCEQIIKGLNCVLTEIFWQLLLIMAVSKL